MKILGALFVAMFLTLAGAFAKTTHADHNRWLPAIPSATQVRVLARGYGIYCVNKTAANYPRFKQQLEAVYADERERVGIPWVESADGTDCDIQHIMVDGKKFPCGAGAAACIYYFNDPVVVYYLGDLLYSDWKTTIGHEHGHWDGSHERYIDSAGRFLCDPNATYTRNSCGTGVWWVTDYDQLVAWNAMVPDVPLNVGFVVPGNGFGYVTWDEYRADCRGQPNSTLNGSWTNLFPGGPAHPTCMNDIASRVAFGHSDARGDPIEWVGNKCGEEYDFCYSPFDRDWAAFYAGWGGCFYLRIENAALWWVPQVDAPNYWTLAGCF